MTLTRLEEESGRITRKCVVRFYTATLGGPPTGIPARNVDITDALQVCESLDLTFASGSSSRYLRTRSGKSLFTMIDRTTDNVCFRFCEVDRDIYLQIEKEGDMRDWHTEEGWGVVECSYAVVLETGLIGVIIDQGPIMQRLGRYLIAKGNLEDVTISPLIHKNIIDRLHRMESLSLFHLRINPSQLPIVRGSSGQLDATLDAQRSLWNEQSSYEVRITPTQQTQSNARNELMSTLTGLAERSGFLSKESIYKVKGRLDGGERDIVLNLLSDELTTEEYVHVSTMSDSTVSSRDTRKLMLDTQSAYNAILSAYQSLSSDINEARGL